MNTATVSSYYTDAKTYLEKTIHTTTSDTYSGISEKIINGETWYYATVTNSYSENYYYSIVNNDKIYKVEFEISADDSKTCSSAHNTVINSLKFK